MITLPMGQVPDIPDTFRCPICGDKLEVDIDAWTEISDGWEASSDGVHATCVSEPDFMEDGYDDWLQGHFSMPYVDWLPVDLAIYEWLRNNYRFTE